MNARLEKGWPHGRVLMKALSALAGLALTSQAAASGCVSPPAGLVGWWPGEGDASDVVGANKGILQGGATANAPGFAGLAFGFDGTNGFVQIPDAADLKPTNLTIEAWVNFSGLDSALSGTAPAGDQYIVFKQNSQTFNFEGYSLEKFRVGGGDKFMFTVGSSSGSEVFLPSVTSISTGVWYHVAAVRGSDFMQLYVNGQLESQTNVSFAQDYGTLPLYFGSSGQSFWDGKLKGRLDEVSLYNRALGSNEIAAIYAAGAAGKCEPLRITAQPQSLTVAVGANVSFNVTAAGAMPLAYQWQRNGTNLVDAGNLTGSGSILLSLTNVQTSDSANYQVVITNSVGAITSAVAVLTVDATLVPPGITTQPVSQTVSVGGIATFSVVASGTPPFSYQWQFNGTNLTEGGAFAGTTGSVLSLNYALPSNSGGYSVVVANYSGSVTSAIAALAVNARTGPLPAPLGLVGWWPAEGNGNDIAGTNNGILQGGATANAPGVVGSAFSLDGTNGFVQIPNAPALNPTNLTVECWVLFNSLDTPGTSTLGAQYVVFKQNTRSTVFEGYNLSKHRYAYDIFVWEVSSAGGTPIQINGVTSLQTNVWYYVAGVRGPDYVKLYINGQLEAQASVNFPQDYGDHPLYFGTSNQSYWDHKLAGILDEVCLYNRALSGEEIAAIYAAGSAGKCKAPTLLAQPHDQISLWGGSVTLGSAVAGAMPLSYQWLKDGSPISGASNSSLVLTNLQSTDAGSYVVLVTNFFGSVTSAPAVFSLKVADLSITLSGAPTQSMAVLTIGGLPGQTCGIEASDSLAPVSWHGQTNLTLTSPSQVWSDPQGPTLPQRYYRVAPGPIPIP